MRPLTVIQRASRRDDFARLAQLVRDEGIGAVLCGLPLNMDGSEGPQAQTVRKWALRLAQALRVLLGYPVPILFWDERLSTYAAQEILRTTRSSSAEDALAAAEILHSYLAALRLGEALDFGRIELPPVTVKLPLPSPPLEGTEQ